jgi:hypothetical protein
MKIAINVRFGGFALSLKAMEEIAKRKNWKVKVDSELLEFYLWETENGIVFDHAILRNDKDLIEVIERLGKEANTTGSNIKIVEIPADVNWQIEEDDCGREWIAEVHRTWFAEVD